MSASNDGTSFGVLTGIQLDSPDPIKLEPLSRSLLALSPEPIPVPRDYLPMPSQRRSRRREKELSGSTKELAGFTIEVEARERFSIPNLGLTTAPPYLQPNSTFFSNIPPHQVFNRICTFLDSELIDYAVEPDKAKITGVLATTARCTFQVRAFLPTNEAFTFECQRRSGCSLAFAQFFSKLTMDLGPIVSLATPSRPLPTLPPSQRSVNLEGCVNSLNDMIQSPLMDVHLEGFRALAFAVDSTRNAEIAIGQPQLMQRVASLLPQDGEQGRCAALLLANISSHILMESAMVVMLIPGMASVLDAPDTFSNREAKRHVATVLAALSKTPETRREIMGLRIPLANHSCSQDLRLRTLVRETLARCEAHAERIHLVS
jgi:hypothetical protein